VRSQYLRHALSAAPYNRYNICWLRCQFVRQLFVVIYEVDDIHVAEILLRQYVLSYLIAKATLLAASPGMSQDGHTDR
jgi:hypothetical protein